MASLRGASDQFHATSRQVGRTRINPLRTTTFGNGKGGMSKNIYVDSNQDRNADADPLTVATCPCPSMTKRKTFHPAWDPETLEYQTLTQMRFSGMQLMSGRIPRTWAFGHTAGVAARPGDRQWASDLPGHI